MSDETEDQDYIGSAQKCARPCGSCPWLAKNQTRDVVLASPIDGRGTHWFAVENLRRHWRGIAEDGSMMPCHSTDPNAPLYGGKFTRAKESHICVGITVLARREMHAFMVAGTNFEQYRAAGGRFTLRALAMWASRLNYGGAVFDIGGQSLTMPHVNADDDRVRLPRKGREWVGRDDER